ncbi:MAG: hypothetical protein OXG58_06860 [Gemmatimonadetes bacterium]|nr:hypothetical protein [Gemmatimonadota bacterium]
MRLSSMACSNCQATTQSMVVRDLRVYAQAMRARVHHYRDNTGLEVDATVTRDPGDGPPAGCPAATR